MFRDLPATAASVLLLGCGLAAPAAHAATGVALLPMAISAIAGQNPGHCGPTHEAAGFSGTTAALAMPSKVEAILGGRPSQLELLRRQQSSGGMLTQQPIAAIASAALNPASGPAFPDLAQSPCAALSAQILQARSAPFMGSAALQPVPAAPEDFLASKRIAIRHTGFDRDWNRVRNARLSGTVASRLIPMPIEKPGLAAISAVNTFANSRITYTEDRELYGQADYWASASETFRRNAGDCEDIAIAKMQLLAALGVNQGDMYLTIARDLARASDHAVLVVTLDGKNWLLDNSTDRLLEASNSYDYRPVFSFSQNRKWIHGY